MSCDYTIRPANLLSEASSEQILLLEHSVWTTPCMGLHHQLCYVSTLSYAKHIGSGICGLVLPVFHARLELNLAEGGVHCEGFFPPHGRW